MRLVTISMSASTRSSSNERRSASGSVPSKAATTNTRQPASRIMASRAALPSCVRLRPGVSTSSIAAMRDLLRMVDLAERLEARRRGSAAIALWPVWASAGSGATPVSQWNSVLLPEP